MEIYKITNTKNGKIYIGKDTTSNPSYFGSGKLIKRAINKYGIEFFLKEIIDKTDNYDILSEKEKYWINFYNSTDRDVGYNISKGGDGGDTLTNNPNIEIIRKKISKNNPKTGKKYEDVFGVERSIEYKNKLKKNIHKSILSDESKLKNKLRWLKYWDDYKKRCEFLKGEIDRGVIDIHIDELRKIRNNTKTNFFKTKKSFYDYFGYNIKKIIDKKIIKKKIKIVKDKKPNKEYFVIINDVIYESTKQASVKLKISRELVRYRLKSPLHHDYKYLDDNKNKKEIKIPYEQKQKKISINGVVFNSINDGCKGTNLKRHSITHRLKSSAYPDWYYVDDNKTLVLNSKKRNKSVLIMGIEYDSISDAARKININREIIRYRLKNDKYQDYVYL